MKSKYYFFLFLFISSTTYLAAQIKHEIKFDLYGLSGKIYTPSYEVILSNKIGIELALGFDRSDLVFIDILSPDFVTYRFDASRFNPSISGKYYLQEKKKYATGFFVGPYLQLNFLLDREEDYLSYIEEVVGREPNERDKTNRGIKGVNYGIHIGYKWLIKNNFIIEIDYTATIEQALGKGVSIFKDSGLAFNAAFFVNAAYRF